MDGRCWKCLLSPCSCIRLQADRLGLFRSGRALKLERNWYHLHVCSCYNYDGVCRGKAFVNICLPSTSALSGVRPKMEVIGCSRDECNLHILLTLSTLLTGCARPSRRDPM